ncbi:ABC transporter permease [Gemmata sp. JC673]|uniref:Transport permease protein n=1 Tax=Gemmata algarum TaxID=2975278 RepID=A0ABU5F3V9_9BACT|nr:ABC transporter permease [Gemmata algarum]MDY3561492.1 ABC transporter permease [Gemmata algarum]
MVVSDAEPKAAPAHGDAPVTPAPTAPGAEPPLSVIEPGTRALPDLRELWRYRELLFFLALRDVKIRYKQTVFGVGWAVAQPLATMGVFALFLGRIAGVGAGVEHYPLFVFAGMVAWAFFSNTVTSAANSVVANERLITKVYFPRLAIPLSTVGVGLFDLVIASLLLAAMAAWFGAAPAWSVLVLPLVVLALAVSAAGVGVLLSALIVAQRDFRFVLGFGVQLWMFATPSLYVPAEALGPRAQALLPLNPAHGLVAAFRQAALGGPFDWYAFAVSAAVGTAVAVAGLAYFRRTERSFADTI